MKYKNLKCRRKVGEFWQVQHLCNPDSSQDTEHFYHPRKLVLLSWKHPPHTPSQVTNVWIFPCCRLVLTVLEFIQWNHTGCTLLCKTWDLSASISRFFFLLSFFFFLKNLFILFIYFWLCWVFIAVRGLSLVAASRSYSSLRCAGFSLRWLLLLWSMGSRRVGFSSCGAWAQ